MRNKRILIVDDDFTSRNLLAAMLNDLGMIDTAVSGIEAMDASARRFNSGEPYDLICLDLKLPGRSGQDVLHFIRTAERLRQLEPVPIIIITGDNSRASVMETAKGGSSGYLIKPFDREHLAAALKRIGFTLPPIEENRS